MINLLSFWLAGGLNYMKVAIKIKKLSLEDQLESLVDDLIKKAECFGNWDSCEYWTDERSKNWKISMDERDDAKKALLNFVYVNTRPVEWIAEDNTN